MSGSSCAILSLKCVTAAVFGEDEGRAKLWGLWDAGWLEVDGKRQQRVWGVFDFSLSCVSVYQLWTVLVPTVVPVPVLATGWRSKGRGTMSRQTQDLRTWGSCCVKSDISLMVTANAHQLAGEQHEVIAQLCFMNWIILFSVISAIACDINVLLICLTLPVAFGWTGPWPWRCSQEHYNRTEAPGFETGRGM